MFINSGMCPFVLCNSVQQDNVTLLSRSHDTDLRQLCTLLPLHSSSLLIIDLQGHLSLLAPDSAHVAGLLLSEDEGREFDNIHVFTCTMKN